MIIKDTQDRIIVDAVDIRVMCNNILKYNDTDDMIEIACLANQISSLAQSIVYRAELLHEYAKERSR